MINDFFEEGRSTLVSRNITVMGRRTSIRLEPEMWRSLKEIASREQCTIHDLCTLVKMRKKSSTSLTAAIRVFLMLYFKASSTEEGHRRASHGNFNWMAHRARLKAEDTKHFSCITALENRPRMQVIRTAMASDGAFAQV